MAERQRSAAWIVMAKKMDFFRCLTATSDRLGQAGRKREIESFQELPRWNVLVCLPHVFDSTLHSKHDSPQRAEKHASLAWGPAYALVTRRD